MRGLAAAVAALRTMSACSTSALGSARAVSTQVQFPTMLQGACYGQKIVEEPHTMANR